MLVLTCDSFLHTGATNLIIKDVSLQRSFNPTKITCAFQNHQSFYCVVCCSTDPSVPPDSSVYNVSSTRGTEVTVDLGDLTSSQMYYCKAAATNTTSANCGGPVVGSIKVTFSLDLRGDILSHGKQAYAFLHNIHNAHEPDDVLHHHGDI